MGNFPGNGVTTGAGVLDSWKMLHLSQVFHSQLFYSRTLMFAFGKRELILRSKIQRGGGGGAPMWDKPQQMILHLARSEAPPRSDLSVALP
jgi:hypothetical protein